MDGTEEDVFGFHGCSTDPTDGQMGVNCTEILHVPEGARLLVRNSDNAVVGEGVCCNSVTNFIKSAVPLNCSHSNSTMGANGTLHVSRIPSVIVAANVTNVVFKQLEVLHSRGGGVIIEDSSNVWLENCTIRNHGMMGINISRGSNCGISGFVSSCFCGLLLKIAM